MTAPPPPSTSVPVRPCPGCGEPAADADRFCEACGTALTGSDPAAGVRGPDHPAAGPEPSEENAVDPAVETPGPTAGSTLPLRTDLRAAQDRPHPCPACGPGSHSEDGFCSECGRGVPRGRDRVEESTPDAAAVTDRGLVRPRNEDAYGIVRIPGGVFAVVCDGVASVPGGAEASLVACEAALEHAAGADGVAGPAPDPAGAPDDADPLEDADDPDDPAADLAGACADAAREAVVALHERVGGEPPACTYVSAVVTPGDVVVAWAGDSRAYWIDGDGGSCVLSTDDSWAAEMVAAGLRTPEEAWADRRAHVITRWVAADAPERPARRVRLRPERPGLVLLCSDGLWNHVPDPDALAVVVGGADPLDPDARTEAARALVAAAITDGGHDNTTVVLVPAGPGPGSTAADGPGTGPR